MGEVTTPAPVGGQITDPLAGASMVPEEWRERARGWKSLADWLGAVEEAGVTPNIGSYIPGGMLRRYVKGMDQTAATPEELEEMKRIAAEAMESGAFGVSYALIYPLHCYASTEEVIEISKVISRYNGHYVTHMRSEGDKILEALEEAMQIGREAGLPVEIYHLKVMGKESWHLMPEVIRRIERARANGQDIAANMYPYEASGTSLTSCLPTWLGGGPQLYQRLQDPEIRRRIHEELRKGGREFLKGGEADEIMPIGFVLPQNKPYIGKRLSEIAEDRGTNPVDTIMDLLAEEKQPINTIFFKMSEENTALQIRQPWVKVSTDGRGTSPEYAGDGPIHPRGYGTYPRVFRRYVREQKILIWEEAVRKMTSSVADRLRLRNRGRLESGYYADVVIFDPETISDRATFEEPYQLSVGVRDVLINGQVVVRDGKHTGAKPGRFVRPGRL